MRSLKIWFLSLMLLGMIHPRLSAQAGKAVFAQGENLRKQNKCDEAIAKYQEAIKLEPENYRYHFALGKCYYSLKQMDQALGAFETCVQKQPDFTPPYSLCAKIYIGKQQFDKAINYYDEAFKYEKNADKKVQYKVLIAQMLMKQGKSDEAMSHIQDAKEINPQNVEILYYDAKINNEQGNFNEAKKSMLTATEQLRDQPPGKAAKYFYELGLAYNKLGDYDNARKAWEKANFGAYKKLISQQLSLNSPSYFYTIAASYFLAGEFEASKENIGKALELQSNFSKAYVLMGKISKKEGDLRDAISQFQTAATHEPDPAKKSKLQMQILTMQIDAGDYSGAVSTANSLSSVNPSPQIIYFKGFAQYKLGQYTSAISTLDDLVNNQSIDMKTKSQYYFIMGMAAKKASNAELAKTSFKNAMGGPYKAAAKCEYDKLTGSKS